MEKCDKNLVPLGHPSVGLSEGAKAHFIAGFKALEEATSEKTVKGVKMSHKKEKSNNDKNCRMNPMKNR